MPQCAFSWTPWTSSPNVGVARADISPPRGLSSLNWAASDIGVNTGQHRALTATAVALADGSGERGVLVSLDLGWWRRADDEKRLREQVVAGTGLSAAAVLIHLVHTHAGPYTCAEPWSADRRPVADYLESLKDAVVQVAIDALKSARPATITWSYGKCTLAVNRDLPVGDREVIAFNPNQTADDTLLV